MRRSGSTTLAVVPNATTDNMSSLRIVLMSSSTNILTRSSLDRGALDGESELSDIDAYVIIIIIVVIIR